MYSICCNNKGEAFMSEHMTKLKFNINESDRNNSMIWKFYVSDLGADITYGTIVKEL